MGILHVKLSPYLSAKFDKTICINWSALLSLAIFWLCGLHAYPAGSGINNTFLLALTVLIYAYLLFNYTNPIFCTRFRVEFNWIWALVFLGGLLLLTWRHLNQPISGDGVQHAQFSAGRIFRIFNIVQSSPGVWGYVQNIGLNHILAASNLLLVGALIFLFFGLPRLLVRYRVIHVIVMLVVLYIARLFPLGYSLAVDPYPIFRLFPLVVSSAIFGATDFGFRMAAYSGFLAFLAFVYLRVRICSDWIMALLATIAIATIPILWHVSYLVEQSAWAAFASASVFVMILSSKKIEDVPLVPLTVLVVLASLLRGPAFVAFIPIAFVIGYRMLNGGINKREAVPLIVSIIALAMFVIVSVELGSPATEKGGELTKWMYSSTNNIPAVAGATAIGLFPLFFVGFLLRPFGAKRTVVMFSAITFTIFVYYIYYVPIREVLWGICKYQAEIFAPLIAVSIVAYCIDNRRLGLTYPWLRTIPLIALISVNLFSIFAMDSRTFKPLPAENQALKAEFEYPMNEAFDFIDSRNLRRNTYYIGVYYGGFISVLRGYSVQDYFAFTALNSRYRPGFLAVDLDALNADPEVSAVVVEPEYGSASIDGLVKRGWLGRRDFTHLASGTKMIVLSREAI